MNIFFLHQIHYSAAMLHCDKHLVKMILESLQILYTALSALDIVLPDTDFDDIEVTPYKPTHKHHPSVLWVLGGYPHFQWLLKLAYFLCARYTVVYGKTHKCWKHVLHIQNWVTEMDVPPGCDVHEWLDRLRDMGVPQKCIDSCKDKVATVNPPRGCKFGVVCAESNEADISSEQLIERTDVGIDLVGSYHKYYAFKAKRSFVMKWEKSDVVPSGLNGVMQSFLPNEELLKFKAKRTLEVIKQPKSKKARKNEACTFCGQPMCLAADEIDWTELGFNSQCDDCCCGACGSRKLYQGQACC